MFYLTNAVMIMQGCAALVTTRTLFMPLRFLRAAVVAAGTTAALASAAAQDTGAPVQNPDKADARRIDLSLNAASAGTDGCRLSFVVHNGMNTELDNLSVEIAIFATEGALDRLLRLNFGILLEDKTRVRQFDLDGTQCDAIGNVLINDVAACEGGELTPLMCLRALSATTATPIAFGL